MKVHRRLSAAEEASEGKPFIRIMEGQEVIYITGIAAKTYIDIMGRNPHQSRISVIAGTVQADHLVRLGYGNKSEASPTKLDAISFDVIPERDEIF